MSLPILLKENQNRRTLSTPFNPQCSLLEHLAWSSAARGLRRTISNRLSAATDNLNRNKDTNKTKQKNEKGMADFSFVMGIFVFMMKKRENSKKKKKNTNSPNNTLLVNINSPFTVQTAQDIK